MEKKLQFDKKKIVYSITGEGPAVVLLHGIPANHRLWSNQVAALAGQYRLIVPDLPGSGGSEMITDMSMEGMAGTIKSILDLEGIPLITLVGHSMGGYISLAFAEMYPGYLNGLGLFHSTAFADTEERKTKRKEGIAAIEKNGAPSFLQTTTPNLFSDSTKQKNPHLVDELIRETTNFSSPALVSYYKAMMERPDRTGILKKLKIPVLLIAGKSDTAIPLNDCLKQSYLPEIMYFHLLTESGHMGMVEEAEKSSGILHEFLSGCSRLPNLS